MIEDMWREATLYPAGDPVKQVYTNPVFGGYRDFNDTFRERIHTFLEQVADGASPEEIDGSGADGLAAQKVIHAAIESIETGKIVTSRMNADFVVIGGGVIGISIARELKRGVTGLLGARCWKRRRRSDCTPAAGTAACCMRASTTPRTA